MNEEQLKFLESKPYLLRAFQNILEEDKKYMNTLDPEKINKEQVKKLQMICKRMTEKMTFKEKNYILNRFNKTYKTMKPGKIIYKIIILIIIIFIRGGIKVTYKDEIILQIHGGIIKTIFLGEILYEFFEIFMPKMFKTIINDIKGNQQKTTD